MTPARPPRPPRRGGHPPAGRGGRRQPAPRQSPGADQSRRDRHRTDRSLGGEQVEGRRAVAELLRAGRRRVRDVWVSDTAEASAVDSIERAAAERRVTVRTVARSRLDAAAVTAAPQGVIAWAEPLEEADLEQLARPATGVPFLVVLDGIGDPQNVGAIFRTAVSAGVTGVVLPRHRGALVTPAVAKAAAGAVEHLPMAVVPGVPSALRDLSALGVWSVGLDAEGTEPIFGLRLATEPLALVFGSEGRGLGRLTRERCEVLAAIPMPGPLPSLNVAAAAAIACFEVARRRDQ